MSHITQPCSKLSHTELGARSSHRPTVLSWVISLPSLTSSSGLLVYRAAFLGAQGCTHALSYPVLQGVEITSLGFERSEEDRPEPGVVPSFTEGEDCPEQDTVLSFCPQPQLRFSSKTF